MDSFVDERDFSLLAQDRYTFAVLDRILRGECELIQSDHQHMILCHSAARYPVWLWTGDAAAAAEKEAAWRLAAARRPLDKGYRYNMKHDLAAYFIERARQDGLRVGITQQLFAYDCLSPVPPAAATDGALYCCTQQDAAEAARLLALFYVEIGEEAPPFAVCLEKAREHMDQNAFFFWKNADGQTVACCSYRANQGLATLGSVYTLPEARRRHYAQHLVYQVTQRALRLGLTPMLYTDAEYPASNACYQKIGYALRGGLCTIAAAR